MTFSLSSEKEQPEQAVAVEKHDDLPIMPGESSEDSQLRADAKSTVNRSVSGLQSHTFFATTTKRPLA